MTTFWKLDGCSIIFNEKRKGETYVLDLISFMLFPSKKCLFCGNSLFLIILEYELKKVVLNLKSELEEDKNQNLNHQEILLYQSDYANIALAAPFCNV